MNPADPKPLVAPADCRNVQTDRDERSGDSTLDAAPDWICAGDDDVRLIRCEDEPALPVRRSR